VRTGQNAELEAEKYRKTLMDEKLWCEECVRVKITQVNTVHYML
jgi:hypothetical protein